MSHQQYTALTTEQLETHLTTALDYLVATSKSKIFRIDVGTMRRILKTKYQIETNSKKIHFILVKILERDFHYQTIHQTRTRHRYEITIES